MVSKTFWGGVAWAAIFAASPAVAAPSGLSADPATAPASRPAASLARKRVREAKPAPGPVTTDVGPEAVDDATPVVDEVAPPRRRGSRRAVEVLPPPRPADLGGVPASAAAAPSSLDMRPTFAATAPSPDPAQPIASTSWFSSFFGLPSAQPRGTPLPALASRGQIDALITRHAGLNGVPETLVHRIVVRESKYNPRAVGRGGAMGLMQIKTATARGVGYEGGPAGLLDAETNLTYGVKYLAGAYRTAGGNHDLAVSHYARGYYYAARRQGLVQTASRRGGRTQEADAAASAPAETSPSPPSLFSFASRTVPAAPAEDRSAR